MSSSFSLSAAPIPADAFEQVEPVGTRKAELLGTLAGATHRPHSHPKAQANDADAFDTRHAMRAYHTHAKVGDQRQAEHEAKMIRSWRRGKQPAARKIHLAPKRQCA